MVGPDGRVRRRGRRQRHLPHPGSERVTSARQVETYKILIDISFLLLLTCFALS